MNATIKTIGVTALGIFLGYVLVRIAERIEAHMTAKKAAAAQITAAPPAAEPVGDRTHE